MQPRVLNTGLIVVCNSNGSIIQMFVSQMVPENMFLLYYFREDLEREKAVLEQRIIQYQV